LWNKTETIIKIIRLSSKEIWMKTHRIIDSAEATGQKASLFGGAETIGKKSFAPYEIHPVGAFDWFDKAEPNSIHAVVTDHPGWYIVWRYLVDPTLSLEPERPVIIWRVDIVFIKKSDWKYEGSAAGAKGGRRMHTFGLKKPATLLKGRAVYQRSDVVISGGKAVPLNGD
jgi:hypothetical protein|tara:strand:+ start:395 stop:904 length:510 start_codon:yes stop_codon:yes gene_type:complete